MKMKTKIGLVVLMSVWLFVLLLIFSINQNRRLNQLFTVEKVFYKKNARNNFKIPVYCDKFIILTTINEPTDHVKYINDALYGWCLIVVADKKTPVDWHYKNVATHKRSKFRKFSLKRTINEQL